MIWTAMLADLIVTFHAAFVGFIVLGLAMILVGAALRWSWVRNPWFRFSHLGAIGIVVAETFANVPCPLTVWERELREAAGQTAYTGDFLGYWAHRLIFFDAPPWVFSALYITFGLVVIATFFLVPPRRHPGLTPDSDAGGRTPVAAINLD
jgi:hypothetical protein